MTSLSSPSTIITGHANADFDALAAMVAASKLYPGATLIFPGSQERNLRNFFIESATYLFNFKQAKDIDFSTVDRLVVVDTRQRARIPHVQDVLNNPHLEIHLYDHHPDSPDPEDDLRGDVCIVRPWGATTTIITQLLQEKGIPVTEEEATLLGLGIFEDTGSFTFNSTTEHDFAAAAWLKTMGMDLNAISELVTRDLTTEQVSILNTLLQSATTHEINGVSIVIAEVTLNHYMGDFALLAHKMMDMENLKVLFALGLMGDKVQLVARSRLSDVDVAQICAFFGGGGHPYAAAAAIKERPLAQVKDELFALLFSSVNPQKLVRHHMSSPAVSVQEGTTIREAEEIMNRYGLKAIPVLQGPSVHVPEAPVADGSAGESAAVSRDTASSSAKPARSAGSPLSEDSAFSPEAEPLPQEESAFAVPDNPVRGYLEFQTAARAVAHGLGRMPVEEYMQRQFQTVSPDDDLYPVMEIVVGNRQRLVPVVHSGELLGVITRTDIINTIVEEPARIPETLLPDKRRERNIRSLLRERLPASHVTLLETAGKLGDATGIPVYAVGGFVRDLLLHRRNLDLDLVVEGDGIAFARKLARLFSGRIRAHAKFRTAVVIFTDARGEEQRIDVATARLEYYEYPAALPTVELSSIKMDLFRRDFTINAQAVQLNTGHFGRLVDFFGAQRDMKDKRLRVLHSLSFVEDPTRILRAIRFEQRFDFHMDQQTVRLVRNALQLGMMGKLSGNRVFHEFELILREARPIVCLRRMEELGILALLHPRLHLSPAKEQLAEELAAVVSWYRLLYRADSPEPWLLYLLAFLHDANEEDTDAVATRFSLSRRQRALLRSQQERVREGNAALHHWTRGTRSMSGLYAALAPLPLEVLLLLMARSKSDELRRNISHFLTQLREMKADITGEDLQQMGESPSPLYGKVLAHVLAAKIDGMAVDRAQQLELAFHYLRQLHASPPSSGEAEGAQDTPRASGTQSKDRAAEDAPPAINQSHLAAQEAPSGEKAARPVKKTTRSPAGKR